MTLRLALTLGILLAPAALEVSAAGDDVHTFTLKPALPGQQLVRVSLPFAPGAVGEGEDLRASDGRRSFETAVRVLTWHSTAGNTPRSVRRAMVTFPYVFSSAEAVRFALRAVPAQKRPARRLPVDVRLQGETVLVTYRGGPALRARLEAPGRVSESEPKMETVEASNYYLWRRFHLSDAQWPRIIEVRVDTLGGVVVVGHLQRNSSGDGYAPDFGWDVGIQSAPGSVEHSGKPVPFLFANGRYRLYHPTEPLKGRGRVEVAGRSYRYLRCKSGDKVPMQQASWRKAEFVVAPAGLAPQGLTLESPHESRVDWQLWDGLYQSGPPLDEQSVPELGALLRYHRDAIARSMAHGDDWGNVTSYSDDSQVGDVFGMNRLNHCPAIFREGYRSGDRRLIETAVLWCDNFYDLSIWWGSKGTGGTRYNNVLGQGRTPPANDRTYMWRSNNASNFCTKGFDSFLLAYEQTGDPRMLEALEAQVAYAREQVHADCGECRNVGAVEDFMRLFHYTGRQQYLDQGLRLFRELRTKLSGGDLFSQGGRPIVPDPPFIDDDQAGYRHPFAKPYIIGYALSGLPDLGRQASTEPKLRDVVRAVADFMAESQDPVGGWRYPHPRSSYVIMSQAMEHAWQLVQADNLLGARTDHLDAIERVLRQRVQGWLKTGRVFAGLTGWEIATGRVKDRSELYSLYRHPADRDCERDYSEGQPEFGSSPPEGLVYFPEVLRFYVDHRPVSRLLTPAGEQEPLGRVLARIKGKKP